MEINQNEITQIMPSKIKTKIFNRVLENLKTELSLKFYETKQNESIYEQFTLLDT
jgi:hypothetical protein